MYGSLTFPRTALTTVPPTKSNPIKAIKRGGYLVLQKIFSWIFL